MAKSGTIAIVDVGTSKVVCLIAHVDNGKPKIIGIGHQLSEGIRAGIVIDIKKAESSILAAVNAAEKMAGLTIDEVVVNISGSTLGSHLVQVETDISGQEVTNRDIEQMLERGKSHFDDSELYIIHALPVEYMIDDTPGIKDPRGMFGNNLSTNLHIITASGTAVRNLTNCLSRCHLNVQHYVASPYMSGISCLTEDERNLGVTLIDIGSANTSIAIFQGGECIYVDSVALGGEHITRDIARGLSTSINYAERLKTLYGSVINTATDERDVIDIHQMEYVEGDENYDLTGGERSYISKALLTSIIKPRVEEILEMVGRNISTSSHAFSVSGPRIVITGGSAGLQGLRELANHLFQKHVRIATPHTIDGMADMASGPAFSTAIGMLSHAARDYAGSGPGFLSDNTTHKAAFRRVMKWFEKNF